MAEKTLEEHTESCWNSSRKDFLTAAFLGTIYGATSSAPFDIQYSYNIPLAGVIIGAANKTVFRKPEPLELNIEEGVRFAGVLYASACLVQTARDLTILASSQF